MINFILENFQVLLYMTMIMFLVVAAKLNGHLSKTRQCPCMVKVPATLFAILIIAMTYYVDSFSDMKLVIPFLASVGLGNFLVGKPKNKFPKLEYLGIGYFVMSYIYLIYYLTATYRFLTVPTMIISGSVFWFYFLYLKQSEYKFSEIFGEVVYSFLLFFIVTLSIVSPINLSIVIGIILYAFSELGLQLVRLFVSDDNLEVEYDLTLIYIISMCFFMMPSMLVI